MKKEIGQWDIADRLEFHEEFTLPIVYGEDSLFSDPIPAAKSILWISAEAIEEGVPLPKGIAAYLSGALKEISMPSVYEDTEKGKKLLSKPDVEKAFKLKKGRGGQKMDVVTKNRARWLVSKIKDARDQGVSFEDAIYKISEELQVPEGTLKDYYGLFGSEEWLQEYYHQFKSDG